MIIRLPIILVQVAIIGVLASCDLFEDETVTAGPGNLLRNSSFENTSGPSLAFWDSTTVSVERSFFSQDTPPSGGRYSVGLRCDADIPAAISQVVVLNDSFSRGLRLTFWVKTDSFPSPLVVHVVRGTTYIDGKSFIPHELAWTYNSLDLEYGAMPGDSVFVILMGGIMLSRDTTRWDQVCMNGVK
jgi:hypothetical protein